MSSLSDFIGGGGGGGLSGGKAQVLFWTSSGTFTFPQAGTVNIHAIGGGGGATGGATGARTGGGAGGTAVAEGVEVTANDSIVITAGAGGSGGINNDNTVNATAGGATTVNSNNISGFTTLTANGGGAGSSTNATATVANGGAGGTGSGGDSNYTGGSGGSAQIGTAGYRAASGGGAPGLFRNGFSAGGCAANTVEGSSTAGAGLGGGTPDASGGQSTNGGSAFAAGNLIDLTATQDAGSNSSPKFESFGGSILVNYITRDSIHDPITKINSGIFSATGGVSAPSTLSSQTTNVAFTNYVGGATGSNYANNFDTRANVLHRSSPLSGGSGGLRGVNAIVTGTGNSGGFLGGGGGASAMGNAANSFGTDGGFGGVVVIYNA